MQLMPKTASQLGVANPFDPQANVDGGTRYLRELIETYNFDLVKALAAYNAGPQRVEQYGGVPPYRETRAYVARIIRDYNRKKFASSGRRSSKRRRLPHSAAQPLLADSKQESSYRRPRIPATKLRTKARALTCYPSSFTLTKAFANASSTPAFTRLFSDKWIENDF